MIGTMASTMDGGIAKGRIRGSFDRLRQDFHVRYTTSDSGWISERKKKVIRRRSSRVLQALQATQKSRMRA